MEFKRICLISLLLMIGLVIGCTKAPAPDVTQVKPMEIEVDWVFFESLEEMLKEADDVLLLKDVSFQGVETYEFEYLIYQAEVIRSRNNVFPLGDFTFKVMNEHQGGDVIDMLESKDQVVVFVKQYDAAGPPSILPPYVSVIGVEGEKLEFMPVMADLIQRGEILFPVESLSDLFGE